MSVDPASGTRRRGLAWAGVTALVSGIAITFNGRGVVAWADFGGSAAYTTLKNLVAAVLLAGAWALVRRRRNPSLRTADRWGLAAVAVIGGSVPFLLFFEGLSRAASSQAGLIHKTLLVWVALLAVPLLGERLRLAHGAAIGLLVAGQLLLVGGLPDLAWGGGEALVLAATLLWSVEVVVSKRLLRRVSPLTVGIARMAGGSVILLVYGWTTGAGIPWSTLGTEQVVWAVVAGGLLFGYVATWLNALARAPAVDVTAVLVSAVLVGPMLTATAPVPWAGLALVAAGVALVVWAGGGRAQVRVPG